MSLVLPHWDCSSATLACLTARLLDRLQSVLNAAARLVFGSCKYDDVTPLLRDLHGLRVPRRITFRLAVLVHRCQHGLVPPYLADEPHRMVGIESRQRLRCASKTALIVLSSVHSTIGDFAFPIATARIWNGLPLVMTSSPPLVVFQWLRLAIIYSVCFCYLLFCVYISLYFFILYAFLKYSPAIRCYINCR